MKKKTVLALLLVICLAALSACGSSGKQNSGTAAEPQKTEETTQETAQDTSEYPTVTVGDKTFELDRDNSHLGLSYLYSSEWTISGYNEVMNLFYGSPENPDFVANLILYENESISTAVTALAGDSEVFNKEINGVNWSVFSIESEGKTSTVYMTDYAKGLYMAVFQSALDTAELQQVFLENAVFE